MVLFAFTFFFHFFSNSIFTLLRNRYRANEPIYDPSTRINKLLKLESIFPSFSLLLRSFLKIESLKAVLDLQRNIFFLCKVKFFVVVGSGVVVVSFQFGSSLSPHCGMEFLPARIGVIHFTWIWKLCSQKMRASKVINKQPVARYQERFGNSLLKMCVSFTHKRSHYSDSATFEIHIYGRKTLTAFFFRSKTTWKCHPMYIF